MRGMPKVAASGRGGGHDNTTRSWKCTAMQERRPASLDGFGDSIQLGFWGVAAAVAAIRGGDAEGRAARLGNNSFEGQSLRHSSSSSSS